MLGPLVEYNSVAHGLKILRDLSSFLTGSLVRTALSAALGLIMNFLPHGARMSMPGQSDPPTPAAYPPILAGHQHWSPGHGGSVSPQTPHHLGYSSAPGAADAHSASRTLAFGVAGDV